MPDTIKRGWEFMDFTDHEDAMGQLVAGQTGQTTLHEIFQPGRVVPLGDMDAQSEPRGLSDYIGDTGRHPDRTPIDVLMENDGLNLEVGYNLMAEGDDSYRWA